MEKVKTIETPQERLELAKRYLENARKELRKSPVDRETGIYTDIKYVASASGKAYLSALEALKVLFLWENLLSPKDIGEKLKKVEMYDNYLKKLMRVGKDKDTLKILFNEIYKIFHLGGYYRELQDKKSIDSGFEKVEKMIKIVEKYVNGQRR